MILEQDFSKDVRALASDGIRLLGWGDGRGPLVLGVHGGLGLDAQYLTPALAPLAAHRRIVCYDQRGHGRSGGLNTLPVADRSILVSDLDAVRSGQRADKFVLFGHSYGGFVALEYALRFPERVAGLVLCATSASLGHVPGELERVVARARPHELKALTTLLTTPPATNEDFGELWAAITPLYFRDHDPARAKTFDGTRFSAAGYAAGVRWLETYDVRDRLPSVTTPTLLMHGRHDWLMGPSSAGAELAGRLPDATLVEFDESGHYPFLEEPELWSDTLTTWLDGLAW